MSFSAAKINNLNRNWEGRGRNNSLTTLNGNTPSMTYANAQPGEQIPHYYFPSSFPLLERPLSPSSPSLGRELFTRSEENQGFPGGRETTYANLVRSYNTKGNGNYPISTPGTGSNSMVVPIYSGNEVHNKGTRPISTRDLEISYSPRRSYALGSSSPSTIPVKKQEASYLGSFSPSTIQEPPYGSVGNVTLPPERKYNAMTSINNNWSGPGNLSGNYGMSSGGTNSGYGGSSPGPSPSNYREKKIQNIRDSFLPPRYYY